MTELPWHSPVIEQLVLRRDSDALPAAIALTCADGWGTSQLLIRVAAMLLEVEAIDTPEEFAHADFRWLAPEKAVIKVDAIRSLNAFAVQTPQSAPRKVVAVADAHLMNVNAANTLLKTLEEPPPRTHILLATAYWGRLLPTIRSRCQRFQVQQSNEQAKQWVEAQGIEFSAENFALSGHAPLAMTELASVDLPAVLLELARGEDSQAGAAQLLEGDVVMTLNIWYRWLVALQRQRPSRAILAMADEINQARMQIESSNATNARLMIERLIHLWRSVMRQELPNLKLTR